LFGTGNQKSMMSDAQNHHFGGIDEGGGSLNFAITASQRLPGPQFWH